MTNKKAEKDKKVPWKVAIPKAMLQSAWEIGVILLFGLALLIIISSGVLDPLLPELEYSWEVQEINPGTCRIITTNATPCHDSEGPAVVTFMQGILLRATGFDEEEKMVVYDWLDLFEGDDIGPPKKNSCWAPMSTVVFEDPRCVVDELEEVSIHFNKCLATRLGEPTHPDCKVEKLQ